MQEILQQLEINQTILVEFVLFIVLFIYMNIVYLKPFQKLIEKRHARTIGDKGTSDKLFKQLEDKASEYENALKQARIKSFSDVNLIIAQAKAQEVEILERAKEHSKNVVVGAFKQLEVEKDQIKKELDFEAQKMIKQVTEKLLLG